MAAPTLFITESQLKLWGAFTDSVRFDGLTSVILAAQRNQIKPLLGQELYDSLLSQIEVGTLTPENQTLVDTYIVPCLANYAHYEWLPYGRLRTREQGIVRQDGQNASQGDVAELAHISNRILATAANYARDLEQYLWDNRSLYPLWHKSCDTQSVEPAYRKKFGLI